MAKKAPNFEQALGELEAIVAQLERGQMPLDESLEKFEKGVGLLRHCRSLLDTADNRVKQLIDFDENGQPRLRTLDHSSTAGPDDS